MKPFLDCSRCLAGQCRYNGCLGSSICLLRSLLLATARLIAGGTIPARMCRLSMFVLMRSSYHLWVRSLQSD